MTSDTIIKQDAEQREKKRVKELIDNVEKLYPAKNKFLYPCNFYSNFAKKMRRENKKV